VIHFARPSEPAGFDEHVRQRGARWLAAHQGAARPKDLWSPYRADLALAFGDLCAYTCMFEPVGTVDHFVGWRADPSLAYEWSNYRFAAQWVNSSKQDAGGLLDPFAVLDGWFEVTLPSLQLVVTDCVPPAIRPQAEWTVSRLHLRDDERVLRQRSHWYAEYQRTRDIEALRRYAPLIARAVEKAHVLQASEGAGAPVTPSGPEPR
jgi:hypothetical protein